MNGRISDVTLEWSEYEPELERYGGADGLQVAERFFGYSSEVALALLQEMRGGATASRLAKALLVMVVLVRSFLAERRAATAFLGGYRRSYLVALAKEEDRREEFLDAFASGYQGQANVVPGYIDEVWERMAAGQSLSKPLDAYATGLAETRAELKDLTASRRLGRNGRPFNRWEETVYAIVSSYMHMMNNRLGVSIPEEAYLAYFAEQALGGIVTDNRRA